MVTFYDNEAQARADALGRGLREKVLCFVVRGSRALVFGHAGLPEAGVQVPAGGVEPGETPAQAAARELLGESWLSLEAPDHLTSYLWEAQLPARCTRQVCHAFAFRALPDTWTHFADRHHVAFRWADLASPGLDWEMDAALPTLHPFPPSLETAHD